MWFEMFLKSDFMVVFGVGHLGVRIVSSVVYCCWLLLLKRNRFGSKGCKLEVCIWAKLLGRLVQASKSVSEPLYILQGAHLLCAASLLVWYLFSFPLPLHLCLPDRKKLIFVEEKNSTSPWLPLIYRLCQLSLACEFVTLPLREYI